MSLSRAQRKLKFIEDFRAELERLNKELNEYKDCYKIALREIRELTIGNTKLIDELHERNR